jgi:hypothetical protein
MKKTIQNDHWKHIDAIETVIIEFNKRIESLEKAYAQHIKAEHIGYDPPPVHEEICRCEFPLPEKKECFICEKPIKPPDDMQKTIKEVNVQADELLREVKGFNIFLREETDKILTILRGKT